MEKKEMKVQFAPGCFDDFDGTQEELQELMAHIRQMAQTGELFESAEPLSDEESVEILKRLERKRDVQ